jgi:hypothetical protein
MKKFIFGGVIILTLLALPHYASADQNACKQNYNSCITNVQSVYKRCGDAPGANFLQCIEKMEDGLKQCKANYTQCISALGTAGTTTTGNASTTHAAGQSGGKGNIITNDPNIIVGKELMKGDPGIGFFIDLFGGKKVDVASVLKKYTIQTVSPTTTDVFSPGDTMNIKWQTTISSTGSVIIYLLRQDGTFVRVIKNITPNNGTYSWVVPGDLVTAGGEGKFKVKVWATMYDVPIIGQSGAFTVKGTGTATTPGTTGGVTGSNASTSSSVRVSVLSPNGGESFYIRDSVLPIRWSGLSAVPMAHMVDISLVSTATNATCITDRITANAGSVSLVLPENMKCTDGRPAAGKYKVKIDYKDPADSTKILATDMSDGEFTLSNPTSPYYIKVTSPNRSDIFVPGDRVEIKWTTNISSSGSVIVHLYKKDGTFDSVIKAITPNTGSYTWTVPSTLVPFGKEGEYKVKVWATMGGVPIIGFSDLSFLVSNKPQIQTTAPAQIMAPGGGTGGVITGPQTLAPSHNFLGNVFYSIGDLINFVF